MGNAFDDLMKHREASGLYDPNASLLTEEESVKLKQFATKFGVRRTIDGIGCSHGTYYNVISGGKVSARVVASARKFVQAIATQPLELVEEEPLLTVGEQAQIKQFGVKLIARLAGFSLPTIYAAEAGIRVSAQVRKQVRVALKGCTLREEERLATEAALAAEEAKRTELFDQESAMRLQRYIWNAGMLAVSAKIGCSGEAIQAAMSGRPVKSADAQAIRTEAKL